MARIVSIVLVFFMLAPIFTPVAEAIGQCGDECALGQNHHSCKHGDTCPMHKKKSAGAVHGGHAAHQGHGDHGGQAMQEGHAGHEDHAARQKDDEAVKNEKALICTVSEMGDEEAAEKGQACFIMSGCDHGNDPLSIVLGTDYLVRQDHFTPVRHTGVVISIDTHKYRGHVPGLPERPPQA